MSLYWENYRKAVEEGVEQTPAQIATLTKEQLFNDNAFDDFQEKLNHTITQERTKNENPSENELQKELDVFTGFDINIEYIFRGAKPTPALWEDLREIYARHLEDEEDEQVDITKRNWFNQVIIQVHVRNETDASPIEVKEWINNMKDHIPGNNFEMSHLKINHADNALCPPDGMSLFELPVTGDYSVLLDPSAEKKLLAAEHEKELEALYQGEAEDPSVYFDHGDGIDPYGDFEPADEDSDPELDMEDEKAFLEDVDKDEKLGIDDNQGEEEEDDE